MARQRPHRVQFARAPGDDFRALLHLWPADQISEQRQQQDQRHAERRKADEPLRPADINVHKLAGDAQRRRIGRQRREEHRTRHRGRREGGPHHIGADLAGCRPRLRAVNPRNVADDRIDGAATARGVRRRRGREHEIGKRDGIAEPQRAAPQTAHQQQRQPPAEAAFAIADREHESANDQPHRAFGEAAKHPAQRLVRIVLDIAHHPREGQANEPDRADRHRFQDQAGDHGCEDCEVVPLIGDEACRCRYHIQHQPDDKRRDLLPAQRHSRSSGTSIRSACSTHSRLTRETVRHAIRNANYTVYC